MTISTSHCRRDEKIDWLVKCAFESSTSVLKNIIGVSYTTVYKKYVYACVYVCMYVCVYVCFVRVVYFSVFAFVFPHERCVQVFVSVHFYVRHRG